MVAQPAPAANPRFQLSLPSSGIISDFWAESQQFVALPHDLQRTIPSRLGAIFIGLNLLHPLVVALKQHSKTQSSPINCAQHLPWITDSILALWKHYRRWSVSGDRRALQDGIITTYLQLVDAVFAQSEQPFTSFTKAKHAMIDELCGLLQSPDLSPVVQSQLASTLINLRVEWKHSSHTFPGKDGTQNDTTDHSFWGTFEKSMDLACQQDEVLTKLQRDLQVSLLMFGSFMSLTVIRSACVSGHRLACGRRPSQVPVRN